MEVTLNLASLITILVSFVLPVVVALVTKLSTRSSVKAILLLLLSAVTSFFMQWLDALNSGVSFSWLTSLLTALLGFAMAVAAHFGLWSPTLVTARAQQTLVKDR